MRTACWSILIIIFGSNLRAQQPAPGDSSARSYAVDSNDVRSIDSIIAALYEVISGPAGERNWERLRSLCIPGVQFNAMVVTLDGKTVFRSGTLEDYIRNMTRFLEKNSFYEKELSRKTEQFAGIAHVFSTYESRRGDQVMARGINSIQLIYHEGRWWIVNLLWNSESEKNPLPPGYLNR